MSAAGNGQGKRRSGRYPLIQHRVRPLAGLLGSLLKAQRHLDPVVRDTLYLIRQGLHPVHGRDLVSATDALPVDHDVRNGAATRHLAQPILDAHAQGMFVQLNHVRRGFDGVLFEEDSLGGFGVGAVGFGEDDDWKGEGVG